MRWLPLALAVACSEYALDGKNPDPEPASPDVEVSPGRVDASGHCADTDAQVEIRNAGTGTLTVSAVAVEGEGWTLAPMTLPARLGAGEATLALLTGTDGDATLVVESDDAVDPVLEIPLVATRNGPPTVSIVDPADGAVLAEGVDVALTGVVGDAEDAADALAVAWTSDATGTLSTSPAAADGTTTVDWPANARASGPQAVTLTATDTCGLSAEATLSVCQDGAYTYDALDLTAWHFEGVAAYDATNGWLQLTDAAPDRVGSAFETSAPVNGDNVEIDFLFYMGDGTGADGISLTALDTTRMTTYLGGTGCGIGYGGDAGCTAGPALPGWSIEIDSYYNGGYDPTEDDHVAFTFDGDVDGPAAWAALPEMEDTGWHRMVVRVLAPRVTVTVDGVTYIDQDVSGTFAFPAYVGFTAGTGGETNAHLIDALQVTDYACD